MTGPSETWLLAIDLQPAFSHPDSPWFTPAVAQASEKILELAPLYGDRVLFTRFTPPRLITGSWAQYYEKWDFALRPEADWLWDLNDPWKGRRSVASHRFSKWAEMRALLGPEPSVALCGVSTDCCVLMTALEAVDDGAHVRVVADACAAKTPEVQERSLALMASRAPQLTIVTAAEEMAVQSRSNGRLT
jgi:nicotinamidase-related amidase